MKYWIMPDCGPDGAANEQARMSNSLRGYALRLAKAGCDQTN